MQFKDIIADMQLSLKGRYNTVKIPETRRQLVCAQCEHLRSRRHFYRNEIYRERTTYQPNAICSWGFQMGRSDGC